MKQTGRHQRVEQWFDEYHEALLRRLSGARIADAEVKDLAQEVFLRVLRVSDPDLVRHPRAYLLKVAAHVLEEWRMRGRRFVSTPPDRLEALPGSSDPPTEVDGRARARRVNRALAELPPMYRAAIALRAQYGFSVAEVAVRLGVRERQARRYIEKAYAKLRQRLADESGASGSRKG